MTGVRSAELEQAIARDPDNPDGYFVYGDWLASQGDPRGELIALQAALLHNPDNKELRALVDASLERGREALLGELAALDPKQLALTWHLGFIHDARIHIKDDEARKATLTALLASPSGAFITSLAVARGRVNTPIAAADYSALVVAHQHPSTLRDLVLGNPGDFDATEDAALTRVFPRLRKSLDRTWASIAATIAEQSRLKIKFETTAFPALEAKPGLASLPQLTKTQLLTGLKLEVGKQRKLGLVDAMKRTYTSASLDKWAVTFGKEFWQLGTPSGQRWGFLTIGQLGHDRAAAWIAEHIRSWTYGRAESGLDLLRQIGTPRAVFEIYSLSVDARADRRTLRAREGLEQLADARKLELEDIIDRSIPFAATGALRRRIVLTFEQRLYAFLIHGHQLTPGDFRRYVLEHPIASAPAQRVVWGNYSDGKLDSTFRITAEGELVDASGRARGLDGQRVGVVHPVELDAAQRKRVIEAWAKALKKAKVEPLFVQLERACYELPSKERRTARLKRFAGQRIGFSQFEQVLVYERDWRSEHVWEEGNFYEKDFYRDNVRVVIHVAYSPRIEYVQLTTLTEGRSRRSRALHPVTASELLWDLDAATKDNTERVKSASVGGQTIEVGMRVRIKGGEHNNCKGEVFWIGRDKRTGDARAGVRGKRKEPYWVNLGCLVVIEDKKTKDEKPKDKQTKDKKTKDKKTKDKKPKDKQTKAKQTKAKQTKAKQTKDKQTKDKQLARGVTVDYDVRGAKGSGFVFWIGENKYGPGLRAGIKDAKTGETVWAAESQVTVTKPADDG